MPFIYGRRGDSGTKLILTDNCREERNALQCTWPLATSDLTFVRFSYITADMEMACGTKTWN